MSDTPRTDMVRPPYIELQDFVPASFARQLERELAQAIKGRDENKAGWDRASLVAYEMEKRAKRAERLILDIEEHYSSRHPARYPTSALAIKINEWKKQNETNDGQRNTTGAVVK